MIILGINGVDGIFHDASATLIVDGHIVASVEEERFNRKKHTGGVPFESIRFCLKKAGATFAEIDHIGYYLDPAVLKRVFVDDVCEQFGCDPGPITYYGNAAERIALVPQALERTFGPAPKARFHFLNHHLAHASSAFYVSPFDDAAILTIDGSGDRETMAVYRGQGASIEKVRDILVYPYSLGFIYTIVAAHLGLDWISGPGKLMGLAGYGEPDPSLFSDVIKLTDDPVRPLDIDLSFFDYHTGGRGLSPKGLERLGAPREEGAPIEKSHERLAASMQKRLEEAIVHVAGFIPVHAPGAKRLCLAGGVALNVRANRRVLDMGMFDRVFVAPAASDAGTSLGCALYLQAALTHAAPHECDVYLGPDIERDFDIGEALRQRQDAVAFEKFGEEQLVSAAAADLAMNRIVGWVQGRMETGPRALGARSILANAANPRAKEELNARVKKREAFRPYAPSVLAGLAADWFDLAESPHMLFEARVRDDARSRIPGVTHVDGTSRPQTVVASDNPRFHRLLTAFHRRTGLPLVLNTSFNRHGEPIVNSPAEAIDVLVAEDMDSLYLGDYRVTRRSTKA